MALKITAVFSKIGFTAIVIPITMLFVAGKLLLGSSLMVISLQWTSLIKALSNTLYDFVKGSLEVVYQYVSGFATTIKNTVIEAAAKLGSILARTSAAVVRAIKSFGQKINMLFKEIANVFKNIGNLVYKAINHLWAGLCKIATAIKNVMCNNVAPAIYNVGTAVANLIVGVAKAGYILTKGTALAVAALFFETPAAQTVSGIAYSLFVLDETIAGVIGTLMDGVYAAGKSLVAATKSLFGIQENVTQSTDNGLQEEEEYSQYQSSTSLMREHSEENPNYYHDALQGGLRYINDCVWDTGNGIFNCYSSQKDVFFDESIPLYPEKSQQSKSIPLYPEKSQQSIRRSF